MKNHIFTILMLLVSISISAQLKVNSLGNIELGSNAGASNKLNVKGESYFDGRIGIGTMPSNTSYKLNLSGNSNFSGGNYYFTGSSTASGPNFQVVGSNSYPGMWISAASSFTGSCLLCVGGDIIATNFVRNSDMRLKKNISILDGKTMLSKLMNIDGKKYEFKNKEELNALYKTTKSNEFSYNSTNFPKGEQYGFVAQEIEKEFPELVKTDTMTSLKAIDYEGMIPILLQSIKEQQLMISELQEQVKELTVQAKLKASKSNTYPIKTAENIESPTENTLYQNIPNPFSQSTTINYYLKEDTQNAQICIYDMNGSQIQCFKLNTKGKGNIILDSKQLKEGLYVYSLIVNGNVSDTKKMLLSE